MIALIPVLTRAGMRAVFRSDNEGLAARITHVVFGSTGYAPTGEETALKNEVARIPIAGGSWVGDFMIHLTALYDVGPSGWVREVGFILSDGTLLCVWSDPATPLLYKTAGVPLVAAFDLTIEALPKGSVTVQAGDIDLTLFFGSEFAAFATMLARHGLEIRELFDRVAALERDRRLLWAVDQTTRNTNDIHRIRTGA